MKQRLTITIRGRRKEWSFEILDNPKYLEEWRADGLIINELVAEYPQWWVALRLPLRLWEWLTGQGDG